MTVRNWAALANPANLTREDLQAAVTAAVSGMSLEDLQQVGIHGVDDLTGD